MSSSRDDFSIAFRSALLQRGGAQKFSLIFLIFLASIIFFLDVFGFQFMKPIRSIINDGIYRVSLVASSPSRFVPQATGSITDLLNIKSENEKLKKALEVYRQKELNVEYLSNQNKNLRKIYTVHNIPDPKRTRFSKYISNPLPLFCYTPLYLSLYISIYLCIYLSTY